MMVFPIRIITQPEDRVQKVKYGSSYFIPISEIYISLVEKLNQFQVNEFINSVSNLFSNKSST